MITFKQFLEEAVRSPERASKLLNYVARRKGRGTPWGSESLKQLAPEYGKIPQLPKGFEWRYSGEHEINLSTIKSNQASVYTGGVDSKIKGKSPIRMHGFSHPDGTNYLQDGNHSYHALRFLGHKRGKMGLYVARKTSDIDEAVRAPERADKLANYLTVRHEKSGKIAPSTIYGPRIRLKNNVRKASSVGAAVRRGIRKHGLKNDRELFNQKAVDSTIHPSKLKPIQDWVEHTSGKFMSFKKDDDRRILVVHHKGEHFIYDGHHRWLRDKLLGRKESNIRVYNTEE